MADSGAKAGPKKVTAASDDDNDASSEGSAPLAMSLSSDEVNFLLYRYLQENGASTRFARSFEY